MSIAHLGALESGIEINIPTCTPGIGKVILSPTSPDLIADVQVKTVSDLAGRPWLFSGDR